MPEITISIDCGEERCSDCEMQDQGREYCEVFQEFIENDLRCGECLSAQDYAESHE